MAVRGRYGDGRDFELPEGWEAIESLTLDTALAQARRAFVADSDAAGSAVDRVVRYYEPEGGYSGALFLGVEPNEDYYVGAADLWAVSTLSMEVPPLTGRKLLSSGPLRTNVTRQLRRLQPSLPVTDLDAAALGAMEDLNECLRTVMASPEKDSNWWVFAAKMCARKRPQLFPVRDSLVCRYLSGWKPMGQAPGQLGRFRTDIQVFAYLMTAPDIRFALQALRQDLRSSHVAAEVDWSDLRLLDIVLWTAATSFDSIQVAETTQTADRAEVPLP